MMRELDLIKEYYGDSVSKPVNVEFVRFVLDAALAEPEQEPVVDFVSIYDFCERNNIDYNEACSVFNYAYKCHAKRQELVYLSGPEQDQINNNQALEIARHFAKLKPESYYAEPFYPHEWVIDAIKHAVGHPRQEPVYLSEDDITTMLLEKNNMLFDNYARAIENAVLKANGIIK